MERRYFQKNSVRALQNRTVDRVLTAVENLENSGNLLILENSGKTQGNLKILREFLYIRCYFFVMQSETHNKPTYKFPRLQWYLYELLASMLL